jgi:hypothetical protein
MNQRVNEMRLEMDSRHRLEMIGVEEEEEEDEDVVTSPGLNTDGVSFNEPTSGMEPEPEPELVKRNHRQKKRKEKKTAVMDKILDTAGDKAQEKSLSEEVAFGQLLAAQGRVLGRIPADGDCLFHAIAASIVRGDGEEETDDNHVGVGVGVGVGDDDGSIRMRSASMTEQLRSLAVAELQRHRDWYEVAVLTSAMDIVEEQHVYSHDISDMFEWYCAEMSKKGTWGGEPELAALATVLQRRIGVWQLSASEPLVFAPLGGVDLLDPALIHICRLTAHTSLGAHYCDTRSTSLP